VEQLAEIGETDDVAWAARNEYWVARADEHRRGRGKREHAQAPLILTGHGMRLRIDRGTLLVHDGFTHYPQPQKEFRFFPGDWRNPSRIVVIDGRGSLSFDVLDWLHAQNIQLVRINWRGEVILISGGDGYACDQRIVRSQFAAQEGGTALELARFLVVAKIANSIETLRTALPNSLPIELVVQRLNRDMDLLREAHSPSISETR
jgi:CRISP-associated protein Cas1